MPLSSSRSRIIGLLLLLAGVLAGCSALRLAYNQAPHLAYWQVDSYFGLTEEQAPRVRAALADWQRWHRTNELPGAARLLARLRGEALHAATADQVCGWFDVLAQQLERAAQQAVPSVAELVLTITPQQIAHLERKHRALNEAYARDFLQPTREARWQAQQARVVERSEDFYGRLDAAQRERIAAGVAQSPFDAELLFAERVARQQAVVHMLRQVVAEHPPAAQVQTMLRTMVAGWQHSPRAHYRDYQQRMKQYNCAFVAAIHNAASPAQRRHAIEKLAGWEGDLRALVSAVQPQ